MIKIEITDLVGSWKANKEIYFFSLTVREKGIGIYREYTDSNVTKERIEGEVSVKGENDNQVILIKSKDEEIELKIWSQNIDKGEMVLIVNEDRLRFERISNAK